MAILTKTLLIGVLLMVVVGGDPSTAQTPNCPCEKFNACSAKPTPAPTPAKQPPKKTPLPPVKFQMRNVILNINPNVDDKQLPGLDFGSGTAEASEYNYNIGKANTSGHFAERRRYVYDTYKLAEASLKNGEITRDNFDKVSQILKDRLEQINEQERDAYKDQSNEALQDMIKDIKTRVDAENAKRTNQTIKEIEAMDLEQFQNNVESIHAVIRDNLAQARALEVLGHDGQSALNRFRQIVNALRKKFGSDCGKQRIKLQDLLGVERMAQLLGESENLAMQKCFTRTIVAKANFGGIQYEAKRCLSMHDKADRAALNGDWFITISGAMTGSGTAQVTESGSGTFNGKASVGGEVQIEMTGSAVLVSAGGSCALRITSSTGVGSVGGYTASMPGVGGNLPISIIDEPCTR